MRRTNRIEPFNIGTHGSTQAVMITNRQLEITRRIEVSPIVNESIIDHVRFRGDQPAVTTRGSQKIFWCICCLFITAGILVLSIVITGLIIIFGKMNSMKKSNIERYDLGDLHYGINNVNYPLNTSLSDINKILIQKYLSDQLVNIPGFRGLVIDGIFVQNKLDRNKRKQRDTSCSTSFIIQNIQVYFDHCSTCINKRNLILHHLFFNITTFRQPFYLLLNNLHIFARICSIPNISHLIIPTRLNTISSSTLVPSMDITVTSKLRPKIKPAENVRNSDIAISTIFDSNLIETTSPNNLEEETTDHLTFDSSQTSTKSTKTTSNIFQFLPFKPSTKRRCCDKRQRAGTRKHANI